MLSYAVLADGGFLRHKIGSSKAPMTAAGFEEFLNRLQAHPALAQMRLHRVYFYDAAPLEGDVVKPWSGEQVRFGSSGLAIRSQKLHAELPKLPFVALRMGELMFRGWAVSREALKRTGPSQNLSADDLMPNVQQKGVDMRIGLDIAALTLKKQVDVIVLVAADSDFVPAMKFARREGAQLYLVPLGHGVRDAMRDHADLVLDLP